MKKALGRYTVVLAVSSGILSIPMSFANEQGKPSDAQIEFFEKKIRPILVENCYVCHSEHHKEAGGLRVDDYKAITNAGRNGQAVLPGNSAKSVLIQRVTHPDDSKPMPPDHRLSESQIADLKAWIDDGAAWPPLVIPKGLDQTLEPGGCTQFRPQGKPLGLATTAKSFSAEIRGGIFWKQLGKDRRR